VTIAFKKTLEDFRFDNNLQMVFGRRPPGQPGLKMEFGRMVSFSKKSITA
jgi:hypothetical protein